MKEWIDRFVVLATAGILVAGLAACATRDPGVSPPAPSGPDAAVASIPAPDIARGVGVLAHDSMTARETADAGAAADTVHVAPPTGEREADRESIFAQGNEVNS